MLAKLSVSAVNIFTGLAAQLDLSARLEGNLRITSGQRDDMAVLLLRLPSESLNQLPQDKFDPALSEVGNGLGRASDNTDLFVLGSDAPPLARFPGVVEVGFQLLFFFND